jgi:GcrA cell cycle regulator
MTFIGIVSTVWSPSKVERLKALAAEGKSGRQIAQDLGPGFTRNAVIGKCKRMGLQLKGKAPTFSQTNQPRRPPRLFGPKALQRVTFKPLPEPPPEPAFVHPKKQGKASGVSFLKTQFWNCRYIIGGKPFKRICCGMRVVTGTSWCMNHYAIVCSPVSPSQRRSASRHMQKVVDGYWPKREIA